MPSIHYLTLVYIYIINWNNGSYNINTGVTNSDRYYLTSTFDGKVWAITNCSASLADLVKDYPANKEYPFYIEVYPGIWVFSWDQCTIYPSVEEVSLKK